MGIKKFMEQRKLHIQMLKDNLSYNKESYSMDVSPITTSSMNILLRFDNLDTGISVRLIVAFQDELPYIAFTDKSIIQDIPDIFNISKTDNLNKQILEKISLVVNQYNFINCFLFGRQKCSFDTNYNTVSFKINNPADFIKFSKELKPFLPNYCLNAGLVVRFLLNDDFSSVNIDYIFNCHIDDEYYSGRTEVVFNELLTAYACEPLNKKLEDLTLRDHTLLAMVKI
jgi:hypothetical protein